MTVTLLHNMSMPPRTNVRWSTGPMTGAFVRFKKPFLTHEQALRLELPFRATETNIARLDATWKEAGFRGAALLFPFPWPITDTDHATLPAASDLDFLTVTDWEFCVNVLARTRSGLLLADTPLALSDDFLRAEWWSDDRRLVQLAREAGARRIDP